MVYGLVRLQVDVVVLEHGHPLREDGEDVPLLDYKHYHEQEKYRVVLSGGLVQCDFCLRKLCRGSDFYRHWQIHFKEYVSTHSSDRYNEQIPIQDTHPVRVRGLRP